MNHLKTITMDNLDRVNFTDFWPKPGMMIFEGGGGGEGGGEGHKPDVHFLL